MKNGATFTASAVMSVKEKESLKSKRKQANANDKSIEDGKL